MIETYKIAHGLYDTAVVPNLMTSQVSHTRGNMYKLQKMHSSMILENIFLLKELLTCETLYLCSAGRPSHCALAHILVYTNLHRV